MVVDAIDQLIEEAQKMYLLLKDVLGFS